VADDTPKRVGVQLDRPAKRFFIVAAKVTKAGTAERKAAEEMIVPRAPGVRRVTVGRRRHRALNVTPHITQNTSGGRSALDARTTRHSG
jgi:hypothetical protein